MCLCGRSKSIRSKPIERDMTQRVYMVPLRSMTNILAVRIAKKDVSIHVGNAVALYVGMEKEKSFALNVA